MADFTSGKFPILVGTSVAGRGLDIPLVQHVINYDMPNEVDEYVHRIGESAKISIMSLYRWSSCRSDWTCRQSREGHLFVLPRL